MVDADIRRVRLGEQEVIFPSDKLGKLEDVSHLKGNRDALLKELDKRGYLYIKGLHDRNEVLAARLEVIKYIAHSGEGKFHSDKPLEQGILDARCGQGCIPFMEGRNYITHSEAVKKVLEGHRPKEFFRCLFGDEVQTFDFKWMRGVHRQAFTGAHMDSVYMTWGTHHLYTMWTPFDDIPVEMGTLTMCEGSHNLPGFKKLQETYGDFDVEKSNLKGTGWFTTDPFEISQFGGQWKTTDFEAGDVLIFPMRTVHMSTANLTDKLRISCDTRWLKASDTPDPRYVGESFEVKKVFGAWAEENSDTKQQQEVTIDEMKKGWGFL